MGVWVAFRRDFRSTFSVFLDVKRLEEPS